MEKPLRQNKTSALRRRFKTLVCRLRVVRSVVLFQELALERLVLAVKNCRGLFVVFALFVFADNAFFFNHSLEAFDSLFQVLIVVNADCCHIVKITNLRHEVSRVRLLC